MERAKTLVKFLLGFPLTAVAFYFIISYISKNWNQVISQVESFNFAAFVSGIFFLTLFFLLRSIAWNRLLEQEGFRLSPAKSIYLLSISEIRRYIPGSVLGFLSRVNNFNLNNIPAKMVVKLILYESVIFLLTSSIISIPGALYLADRIRFDTSHYLFIFFLGVSLFLVLLAIYFSSKKYREKANDIIKHLPKFGTIFLLMCVAWIFFGLGTYLVGASINYLDPRRIVELVSFFVLSWVIGYLVVIAPLGLGVREAVITFGLSSYMPLSIAAAISILSRIAMVISEVIFLAGAVLFYKLSYIEKKINYQMTILWTAMASYIAYFSYVSFQKHLNFFTGRFDLGNMDQTVWNSLHGRFFEFTDPSGTEIVSRLAYHADFILIILSPFYLLWEDPRMLLLIQTVVIAFGAYFVYRISDFVLKNKNLSLILALSYLLNPFIQKQNLFDFHSITLATTFLLAAFYFSLVKKNLIMLIFLVLTVLTKENMYAVSFIFGIYLAIKNSDKRWIILSILSIIMFYLMTSKFIPDARGSTHFAVEYFSEFGASPMEVSKNIMLSPFKTISEVLNPQNFDYLLKLLLPVGFLPVAAPLFLILALPDLIINLLSRNNNLISINFHYSAAIIPFLYISAVYGAKRILATKRGIINAKRLSLIILCFALFTTYRYGTLPGSKSPTLEIYTSYIKDREVIKKVISQIPRDLSVAATNNLGAHLSQRKNIFTIPQGINEADVIVFLLNDAYAQPSLSAQKEMARQLRNNPDYVKIYEVGDFVEFSKKEFEKQLR